HLEPRARPCLVLSGYDPNRASTWETRPEAGHRTGHYAHVPDSAHLVVIELVFGGLCEKRVTLLVTLRVRCLISGIAWAWQPPSSSRPGPSGTGSGRLDAVGEERR